VLSVQVSCLEFTGLICLKSGLSQDFCYVTNHCPVTVCIFALLLCCNNGNNESKQLKESNVSKSLFMMESRH